MGPSRAQRNAEKMDLRVAALSVVFDACMQVACADELHATLLSASLFEVIDKMPLICKALANVVRADLRYPYVLYFERIRHDFYGGHSLDCAGAAVQLCGWPSLVPLPARLTCATPVTSVPAMPEDALSCYQLPSSRLGNVRLRDVGELLTKVLNRALDGRFLGDGRAPLADLPAGLPIRVHALVADARRLFAGLVESRPNRMGRCAHAPCGRLYFCSVENDVVATQLDDSQFYVGDAQVTTTRTYWRACAGPASGSNLMRRSYCSAACYCSAHRHLEDAIAVPLSHFYRVDELRGDESASQALPGSYGLAARRSRVPKALRDALKRNEAISRSLRRSAECSRGASSDTVRRLREQRVRMANVDLGLLLASSVVAESYSLSVGRVLPGARKDWRARPEFVGKAVRAINALYDAHHRDKQRVIGNLNLPERFLDRIKQKATEII